MLSLINKDEYYALVLRELKHRYSYKRYDEKMRKAMERYKNCKEKKDINLIKEEINICKRYWKCFPMHYFRYNLYERKCILSNEELLNYIPEFFFYNVFLNKFDSKKYEFLLEDKNITDSFFDGLNIKQAKTIGRIVKGVLINKNFEIVKDIKEIIRTTNALKIFIKPVDGQGGYGIYIFNKKDGNFYSESNEILDKKFIDGILSKDYIIQEALVQSEEISNIYDKSVNTFRIATENLNGNVRVVCATLRMGKDGRQVDNSAQDGLVVGINVYNGEFYSEASTEEGVKYKKHPDSKFEFKNKKILRWNEIKKFAEDSARKLGQFTYLGWDIALTDEGPVAIEANLGFGIDHYQAAIGGIRRNFNIEDPQKYWKEKI